TLPPVIPGEPEAKTGNPEFCASCPWILAFARMTIGGGVHGEERQRRVSKGEGSRSLRRQV
ncbi:MAG: hypothetical protein ACLQIQ_01365, partial [Beijerinckiaceae bacterium]